ncbi:YbjN domain-containing protein [Pseudomonas sp. H9]|uniref:YbjN domain-containing protein n=1 Tax=Pseudomonas sp. H9 TaxID=483968 RepID=UPI001057CD71|nr:YbjN domain-containing protein [Pseudomonas sp. H9]TDF82605.1 YbjN domain-containing protein [Pseudomonas sp. H9]
MSSTELIDFVTADSLTSLLQDAGCRVNRSGQGGVEQLLTASQGIGFSVRFGNPGLEAGRYLDFIYSCALHIQGTLPEGLVNQWNASRRFARLSVQGAFLVMEMDVIVADGISQKSLLGSLVLWDRLLQEAVTYLRDYKHTAAEAVAPEAVAAS